MTDIETFIRGIPKAELHMHLEGCIEPDMMFSLATRNGVPLRWNSPEALREAYQFDDLQSFLNLYFEGCKVLVTQQDFYDITFAYLKRAHADNVLRAEMFIGPQSFTERGVPLASLMDGVLSAIDDAASAFGISGGLLVSAHRHRTEAEAIALLDSVMGWKDRIAGFGMGGAELPNPPSKFVEFFKQCHEREFKVSIHAGEEGPASYVREAIELLRVDRIDHGNSCLDDVDLVRRLVEDNIPLTVCPLSNLKLKVVTSMDHHPLKAMLEAGLIVTINSDDPPYFGGYVNDNLVLTQKSLGLSIDDVIALARNSLAASFVTPDERSQNLNRLDAYCRANGVTA